MKELADMFQVLLSFLQRESPLDIQNLYDRPLHNMAYNSPKTLFRMNCYPFLNKF